MKIAGMVILAALTGWLVRGIRFEDPPPQPTPVTQRSAQQPAEPVAGAPSVIRRVPVHESSLGGRNLFAYRVRETPPVTMPIRASAPVLAAPPPATITEPPAPQPIPFPYRYIGTFGPAHNRIAALKRDGDVVTVRAGDRIGDFVLKSIGIESIEIDGPDGTRRIPLTSDV